MTDGIPDDTLPLRAPSRQPTGGGDATGKEAAAKGGVARSSLLMAVGTVVSRATGLFRNVLQAAALHQAVAPAPASGDCTIGCNTRRSAPSTASWLVT
ncbi:hypothetical protein ACH4LK_14130, partial [Streptomyces lydicus]